MNELRIDGLDEKTSSAIKASVLTHDAAFDAINRDWDELLEESDQHVFFLRWSWNRLWWRILRPSDSQLFIITCRDTHNKLVGLAPFYLRQRHTAGIPHVRELLFLGTGIYAQTSEYLDIVARRGYEFSVAETVVECLKRSTDWDRLSLQDVPNNSAMLAHLKRALGEQAQVEVASRSYWVDTTGDWESFVSGLSTSARNNVLRRTRRLFNSHPCRLKRVETRDELEPAMNELVRLHQARWQSKGEPGTFALPNVEEFLKEAMRACLAEGRLGLTTLEVDGEVAAARLDFIDNHVSHAFQAGYDPTHANQGLGSVMNGLCIRDCIEDERVYEYDLMSGNSEYKESWTKNYKESVYLTLDRPGTRSAAYKSIEMAKVMGKSFLRATIPGPIRLAGHRLITQRHYK
jgi:CelD/BcsL family acetyltransferase involved in cellulose biosynthesis